MLRIVSFLLCLCLGTLAVAQEVSDKQELFAQNTAILASIDPELMIVYPAENEKYTITIFTDVFCPYCRQLHQNLDQFLERGISVKYVPFPLYRESNAVLESIWCAPIDQQKARMDIAMLKHQFSASSCDFPVIEESKNFAKALNVYGTPSIFLDNGRKVSGFMSPEEIYEGLTGKLNFDEWRPKHLK